MDINCVVTVPIFNHLSNEDMNKIASLVKHKEIKKNQFLYMEGDNSSGLYVLHSGKIRIYKISSSGKEQLIRILKPGDFTGELSLFQTTNQNAFAQATKDSKVCMIAQNDLHKLLQTYPDISIKILSEFAQRLNDAENQALSISSQSVISRIANYLLDLSEEQDSNIIQLPMMKKDLSSYLGTTAESISRNLKKLSNFKIISVKKNKIEILNIEELEDLVYSD